MSQTTTTETTPYDIGVFGRDGKTGEAGDNTKDQAKAQDGIAGVCKKWNAGCEADGSRGEDGATALPAGHAKTGGGEGELQPVVWIKARRLTGNLTVYTRGGHGGNGGRGGNGGKGGDGGNGGSGTTCDWANCRQGEGGNGGNGGDAGNGSNGGKGGNGTELTVEFGRVGSSDVFGIAARSSGGGAGLAGTPGLAGNPGSGREPGKRGTDGKAGHGGTPGAEGAAGKIKILPQVVE